MLKAKTRKSVLRRFKVTPSGKVLHRHAFRRHLHANKSKKQLGNLKKVTELKGQFAKRIRKALGK
jgi:large subunit ribosomal protein L35